MADRKYTVVFYTAVAVAAVATYGVYRTLEAAKTGSQLQTMPVVVALQDMPEGSAIDAMRVSVAQWPAAAVPAGAFSTLDSVVGRVTRVNVFKGEPIVPGRLAPPGTGPGLEVKITPGKRAMAVRINDVAGISGLIQPNSRVDVLVTLRNAGDGRQQVAKLFMENMRVLSVGTQVQRGDDGKPIQATTATLEVTPEEAEKLAVAANQGSVQLVLRGYGEMDSVQTKGATSRDVLAALRDLEAPPPATRPASRPSRPAPRPTPQPAVTPTPVVPQPRKPDSLTVRIYRGEKMTQQKLERSDSSQSPDSVQAAERP